MKLTLKWANMLDDAHLVVQAGREMSVSKAHRCSLWDSTPYALGAAPKYWPYRAKVLWNRFVQSSWFTAPCNSVVHEHTLCQYVGGTFKCHSALCTFAAIHDK